MGRLISAESLVNAGNYIRYCLFLAAFHLAQPVTGQSDKGHSFQIESHQDKYFPGDTVFLKAYFLDSNRKGVIGKHMASVHLVNNQGKSIMVSRFNVLAGIGHNQLILPDSMPSGFYNVTAFMPPVESGSPHTALKTIAVVNDSAVVPLPQNSQTNLTESPHEAASAVIKPGRHRYGRRESVAIQVQLLDQFQKPIEGEFSISVYNKSLGLRDTLLHGENSQKNFSHRVTPESLNVFQKTGSVFNAVSGKMVPDNTQVLFYLQREQWYHQTFTLKGRVRLNLPQFAGEDELFYLAESPRGEIIKVRIEWDSAEAQQFDRAPERQLLPRPDAYATYRKHARLIDRSYSAFVSPSVQGNAHLHEENFDLVEPDNIIEPDNYVPFQNLAEMIREVIPALYHRKHGETDVVRLNLPNPLTATSNPVYIIDGKATTDTKYFLSIPPSEIDQIGLVKDPKKLLPLRLLGKNGIVIIKSRSGQFVPRTMDKANIVKGLDASLPFRSTAPSSNAPAFRATLYWQPSVSTDKSGRATLTFYTTDDVGEMIIEVRGITMEGTHFTSRSGFEIK